MRGTCEEGRTSSRQQEGFGYKRFGLNVKKLARPERFELPTYCFVASRSTQLSYGRANNYFNTGRGQRAVTAPRMPPRAVNLPVTTAETGLQAATRSSRMRLIAFS